MMAIVGGLTRLPLIKPEGIIYIILFIVVWLFTLFHGKYHPDGNSREKAKATRPKVNKHLLTKEPIDSVIFGKYKGKYVTKPLSSDGHVLIIGGSGSGKSSCLAINSLLACKNIALLAIDIKGELNQKTADLSSDDTVIFQPLDQSTYGYDPLWRVTSTCYSEQTLYESMQTIVFSLIPISAKDGNTFWKGNARNLLLGLFLYEFKVGHINLIDIVDNILAKPMKELLEEIEDDIVSDSIENKLLSNFYDMADETLGGVQAEALQGLSVLSSDEYIRHAFRSNHRKMNPSMLSDGKKIFLSIPEHKLASYSTILQLIINQTLEELEKRPEDSAPMLLLIDELARILSAGKLERLLDAARTLRSRKVTLLLITQSLESLQIAYSEAEVNDLVSNCPYIVVLSASSHKTIQSIAEWCGKYLAPSYSISGVGTASKESVSYRDKPIVDASELMTLPLSNEAILISPYGYSRIKKTPYYSDVHFKRLHEQVAMKNKAYLAEQEQNQTSLIPEQNTLCTPTSVDALMEWNDEIIELPDFDIDNPIYPFESEENYD